MIRSYLDLDSSISCFKTPNSDPISNDSWFGSYTVLIKFLGFSTIFPIFLVYYPSAVLDGCALMVPLFLTLSQAFDSCTEQVLLALPYT